MNKGFTLVELMIVVAIGGILTALFIGAVVLVLWATSLNDRPQQQFLCDAAVCEEAK